MSDHVPEMLMTKALSGLNLVDGAGSPATLAGQLSRTKGPTLLVFLRHFGCIFCREMLSDVRKQVESNQGFPNVLVFCQADVQEATDFFARHWPDATVVCDREKQFYAAMELGRGTVAQMFGPRAWACGLRAMVKGNSIGFHRIIGDPWTMPGLFLVSPVGEILWQHEFDHAGDHPDFSALSQTFAGLTA